MLKKTNLVPQPKINDPLFNRRVFAYYGLAFSVLWFLMVFWTDVFVDFEVGKVMAYLGVPAAIAGLGFWEYLKAAKKGDDRGSKEDA